MAKDKNDENTQETKYQPKNDYSEDDLNTAYSEMWKEIYYNESNVYVNSSFINKMKNTKNTYSITTTKMNYDNQQTYSQIIAYIDEPIDICTAEGVKNIKSLNDDEIVINEAVLNEMTNYDYEMVYENSKNKYSSKEELIQVLEITGIMFIIVILSNVIPVRKITKMKPIDAILNK